MPTPYIDLDSDRNYSKAIEQIIEERKKPIKKLEEEKKKNKTRIKVLREIKKEFGLLGIFSDKLHGFRSVFNRRLVSTKDDRYLNATAINRTKPQKHEVEILQKASNHKISSKNLSKKQAIPAGNFVLEVNKKKLYFNFSGGSLRSLASLINNSSSKMLTASTIKKGSQSSVLVLSSAVEGKQGKIKLIQDSNGVLSFLDVFKEKKLSNNKIKEIFSYKKPNNSKVNVSGSKITLLPQSTYNPTINKVVILKEGDQVSFSLATENIENQALNEKERQHQLAAKKFNIKEKLKVEELQLDSALMIPYSKETKEKKKEKYPKIKVTDRIAKIFYKENGSSSEKNLFLKDLNSKNVLVLDRSLLSKRNKEILIEGVEFINESENKHYLFSKPNFKIKEKEELDNSPYYAPNEVNKANNSKIVYKGIEVERDSNKINDLIDGVNLEIKEAADKPIRFSVGFDDKEINDSIINFIGQYNICMELLNIVLNRNEADENIDEKIRKKYGLFKREYSFSLLKNKMRNIVIRSYKTSLGNRLSLLVQLGISPLFFLGNSNNVDFGKLDFNQDKYKEFFLKNPNYIGEIFGFDSDNDGVTDTGCAYEIKKLQKAYTKSQAMFDTQVRVNQRRLKDLDNQIAQEEKNVENYRLKTEKEFRELEAALKEQETMEKWIDNSVPKR